MQTLHLDQKYFLFFLQQCYFINFQKCSIEVQVLGHCTSNARFGDYRSVATQERTMQGDGLKKSDTPRCLEGETRHSPCGMSSMDSYLARH